jgi:hypothetical protein
MGGSSLQVLYARAMTKLWEKVERLRRIDGLKIADFGTRRRHWVPVAGLVRAGDDRGAGGAFIGTSNCLIAMRRDIEAIGTNAHELPMVYAALAETDAELAQAPYQVLADWHEEHDGNLRIILPDTYGTEGFLARAPDWLAGLDRHPHRFGRPGDRGRNRDPLVAGAGRGSAREAGDLFRRAGRGPDRGAARRFGPGEGQLRLGHAADQRFPRAGGG